MIKNLLKEALILKSKGYYKHAIEKFYKALEIDNNSQELLLEIAETYFFMKETERALSYIEQILEKKPTHLPSLKLLKNIFISKQAWQEAKQTAENIYYISQNPNDLAEILKFLNKQHRYEEVLNYNIETETEDLLLEIARANFKLENYQEAENLTKKLLELNSNNNKALLLKGEILLKTNKDEEAYKILEKIQINPQDTQALCFAGNVYQRCGDYKKSIEYFLNAVKCSNNQDECYYYCASTYFKAGDITQAKKYYNLAISKSPDNVNYKFALANLYYSEKNYKRAFEELNFDLDEANLLKAIILYDTGYLAIAKKLFDELAIKNPKDNTIKEYIKKIEQNLKI